MEEISLHEFRRLFLQHRRAFHLEMKEEYHVEEEDEEFRRFRAGEIREPDLGSDWGDHIRDATSAGCAMQRLRIVSEPLNDYARFLLAHAAGSVAAGEDIRYLPRDKAAEIDLPQEDCWLFDDSRLVLVLFPDDGRKYGMHPVDDRELTARYVAVRDQVWAQAIPYAEYAG
jgi:Family of unknown function (DUF6879)